MNEVKDRMYSKELIVKYKQYRYIEGVQDNSKATYVNNVLVIYDTNMNIVTNTCDDKTDKKCDNTNTKMDKVKSNKLRLSWAKLSKNWC